MCALPIVSGSEVNTPTSGVRMDSSAFRNAALAPGRIAAAIGQDVGGFFQEVSQKIQENQNARRVFDADLAMRKTKDDFTANLANMPDEGTWLPAYKAQVDSLRESTMASPHIGPDVRRILDQKFDVWEAATTSEVRTAALLKGAKETRESAIADATYAAHSGDIEGAMNTLNAAVENHAMTPGDVKKIAARFPSIAAQAQAETAIATNPIKAPDLIKQFEGTIEPRVYVGVMAHAYEMRNKAQADNLNNFAQDLDNSPDGTIDPKVLQEAVKKKDITQRGMDGLLNRMKQKNQAEARDTSQLLMADVLTADATTMKDPEAWAKEVKEDAAELPSLYRNQVTRAVDAKLASTKRKDAQAERPIETETYGRMRKDFEEGWELPGSREQVPDPKTGVLGFFQKTKPGEKIEPATEEQRSGWQRKAPKEIRDAANMHFAQQVHKMRDWFAANPKATPEEAETYRQSLMQPYVMEQVKQALTPPPPTPATVRVKSQAGKVGTIPAANLEKALAAGYTEEK